MKKIQKRSRSTLSSNLPVPGIAATALQRRRRAWGQRRRAQAKKTARKEEGGGRGKREKERLPEAKRVPFA